MKLRTQRIASARRFSTVLGAILSLGAAGCPKPPPPPPPPHVEIEEPPPKCEALSEKCKAKKDTRARIPGITWVITPPRDWIYAQESLETIAEKVAGSDRHAVFAVVTFEPPKQGWEIKKLRLEMLGKLSKKLGIVLRNKDVFDVNDFKDQLPIGDIKVDLFEQEGAKRGDNNGAALVVVGKVDSMELVMLAFAPPAPKDAKDDGVDDARAVMESIGTLKKGSSK